MEKAEINNVANRKRINIEVEKLREKVSKETAKIIKLKVAQDTAYWDLKEKLQQVEGNHERLQQNMVEVQMQYETISGQYQDELRLRPDTLNKLSSTREICDVLEEYAGRVRDTLGRCRADAAALAAAHHGSGRLVRQLAAAQRQDARSQRQRLGELQDNVQVTSEQHGQLLQLFSASRHQAEADIAQLKEKLDTALRVKEDLSNNINDLKKKLDLSAFDAEKKQETIANLQQDMKQLVQEFNMQSAEAKCSLLKQEDDLKKALEANSCLKVALTNQEEYTKTVIDKNDSLQETLAALEEEKVASDAAVRDLRHNLQESTIICEKQKNDIATMTEEKERLLQDLRDKEQLVLQYGNEIEKLKEQISLMDNDKCQLTTDLNKTNEELNVKCKHVGELTTNIRDLNLKIEQLENQYKGQRESLEEQVKELTAAVTARDSELDSKAAAIAHLMSELKISTDVRSKLETTLQKVKKEIDIDKENVKDRERKMTENLKKLENDIKEKEDELSKQMTIILDIRNEKDRLQEKIQGMQNTIDNIQKELTGRPPPPPTHSPPHPPELDDNAVVLTPHRRKKTPPSPIMQKTAEFAVPRKDPKMDMLYNLFSDSSMEGDTLDVSEVNRRFAAMSRGERVSPMPLGSLKRRGGVSAHAPHRALKQRPKECDGTISLSQVKNDMNKERSFFKNKRADNKIKKMK